MGKELDGNPTEPKPVWSRVSNMRKDTSKRPEISLLQPFGPPSKPSNGLRRTLLVLVGLFILALSAASASASIWIQGSVLNTQGKPLADAQVSLYPMVPRHVTGQYLLQGIPGVPSIKSVDCSEQGLFKIAAPEVGMWRLQVSAPGYVGAQIRLTPLLESVHLEPVSLEVDRGLEVRVLDERDQPVVGAGVVAYRRTPSRRESHQVGSDYPVPVWHSAPFLGRADESGWIRIPSAEKDAITLQVVAQGFAQKLTPVQRLSDRPTPVRLEKGVSTPLKVLDNQGRPVAGVLVFQQRQPYPVAETGADGSAKLSMPAKDTSALNLTLSTLDGRWGSYSMDVELGDRKGSSGPAEPKTMELVLSPSTSVRGIVIDRVGREAVPGALVWDDRFYGRAVRAGQTGEFEIALPSDEGWLSTGLTGYRPLATSTALRHLRAAGRGDLASVTLELQPIALVSGQVVNAQGEGVKGVKVVPIPSRHRLGRDQGDKKGMATGEDGAFTLPRLLAGVNYRVLLSDTETLPVNDDPEKPRVLSADTWVELASLEPGERREGLVWTLDPARHGEGWVVDEHGSPVVGAEVTLRRSSGFRDFQFNVAQLPPDVFKVSTDAEGRFHILNLPAARYDLSVKGSNFAPTRVPGIELPVEELSLAGPWDLGTVTLGEAVALRGKVEDEQGRGIEGAEVNARPTHLVSGFWNSDDLLKLETDAEGKFSFDDLAPGQAFSISVRAEGYLSREITIVKAPQDDLKVTLSKGARLTGRVIDTSGWPVIDAQVQVQQESLRHMGHFGSTTAVDEDGRFTFESVSPGPANLEVQSDQKLGQVRSIEVPLPGGEDLHVEIVLEDGATVSGRVTTDQGDPVPGAFLTSMSREPSRQYRSHNSGMTDAEGLFELRGLSEGRVVITAFREPYLNASEEVEVTDGSNFVEIVFETGHPVTGRVSGEDGQAIVGAEVSFQNHEKGHGVEVMTDSDGLFQVKQLATGKYKARASKDYGRLSSEEVEIEILGPTSGLEFVISENGGAARVTGRIEGLELDELSRVTLRAQGSSYREGRVDYDGRYEILGLAPGEWRIVAQLNLDGRSAQGVVTLEEGQTEATLDLEFRPGFELRGTVRLNGKPAESMVAMLTAPGEQQGARNTWTHHDGTFLFRDLEAGDYQLIIFNMTGFRLQRDISIDGDREITIEPRTARVAGRVLNASGEPVGGSAVLLYPNGEGWQPVSRSTRSDGRFDFPAVEEGDWVLVTRRSGYREHRLPIQVQSGGEVSDEAAQGANLGGLENLEIQLESAAVFRFEAKDASGQAVTTLHYVVTSASGERVDGGFVHDALGRFRIDTVPPGTWQLWLQKGLGALQAFPITASSDPGSDGSSEASQAGPAQSLVLQSAVPVSLTSGPGLLNHPFTLSVVGQEGSALPISTDLQGKVAESGELKTGGTLYLPLGTWTVRMQGGDGAVVEQVLVLGSPETPAELVVP